MASVLTLKQLIEHYKGTLEHLQSALETNNPELRALCLDNIEKYSVLLENNDFAQEEPQ